MSNNYKSRFLSNSSALKMLYTINSAIAASHSFKVVKRFSHRISWKLLSFLASCNEKIKSNKQIDYQLIRSQKEIQRPILCDSRWTCCVSIFLAVDRWRWKVDHQHYKCLFVESIACWISFSFSHQRLNEKQHKFCRTTCTCVRS